MSENAISIEIPDTVTEISDDALNGCKKLEKIKYKNKTYTLSNKSDLIAAIHGEEGLTITSDGKLTKVSPELTEVKIPNSVTTIGNYAFYDCTSLKSITIPDSITTIYAEAFSGCKNLTSIIIGNGVTSIGKLAFNNCINLTDVIIGDSLETIIELAFHNCKSLKKITLPRSVSYISDSAFENCTNIVITYHGMTYDYTRISELSAEAQLSHIALQ